MVKLLHWTDMGMCLDVAPDNRPLYVTASDYDALAAELAAHKRLNADLEASDVRLRARIRELEAALRWALHRTMPRDSVEEMLWQEYRVLANFPTEVKE
jgi:hypothetical protein